MDAKLNNAQTNGIAVLRIISCIAVVSIHLLQRYGDGFPFSPREFKGQDGLWMFMILSGFLQCYSNSGKCLKKCVGGGNHILHSTFFSHFPFGLGLVGSYLFLQFFCAS